MHGGPWPRGRFFFSGEMPKEQAAAWFMEQCPLHNECTAKAWARAKVHSTESEEDCRQKLLHRLQKSSRHWRRDAAELQEYVDLALAQTD